MEFEEKAGREGLRRGGFKQQSEQRQQSACATKSHLLPDTFHLPSIKNRGKWQDVLTKADMEVVDTGPNKVFYTTELGADRC